MMDNNYINLDNVTYIERSHKDKDWSVIRFANQDGITVKATLANVILKIEQHTVPQHIETGLINTSL